MSRAWHDQPAVLHQLVKAQARQSPDRTAAVFEDQWISYGELVARSGSWASRLRRLAVEHGTPVGIYLERSLELPTIVLAILEAGGVCIPLEPSDPSQRVATMIREMGPSLIVTQRSLRQGLPATAVPVVIVDEEAPEDAPAPRLAVTENNLAFVLLTSGSTGVPKGVMVSHAAVAARMFRSESEIPEAGRCMAIMKTPISNSPFLGELFAPLLHGCYFVIARPGGHQDIPYLGSLLIDHGVSHIAMSSAALGAFLEWPGAVRCHSLKAISCGGEAVTDDLRRRFSERFGKARLIVTYGTTEAGHKLSYECPLSERLEGIRIGTAIPDSQVQLLDPGLEPIPSGEVGEMYLGGPRLAIGYWNRPAWTADRFVPHPFSTAAGDRLYRSGDLGRLRPDGDLEFKGRVDQLVKIRGNRVELAEIEAALARHPRVPQAVVIVREDGASGKRLVAYLVSPEGGAPATSELRQWLGRTLPEYMIPAAFVTMPALPVTQNGKVDRRALPAPDAARPILETDFTPPRSAIEERLARIWCEILRLDRVGIHDDFFELGGHSLLVLSLWSRIEESFGQNHPVNLLFRHRTIAALAAILGQGDTTESPSCHPENATRGDHRMPPLIWVNSEATLAQHLDDVPIYPLGFYTDEALIWGVDSVEEIVKFYIKRLREQHPRGPYRLTGFCGAALFAFEMARQLREQGEQIPLLVLIAPSRLELAPGRAWWRSLIARFSVSLRRHIAKLIAIPRKSWPAYFRGRVTSLLGRIAVGLKLRPAPVYSPLFWTDRAWLKKALMSYKPGMYPGKVTLVLASQTVELYGDSDFGWGRVALGGLDVQIVPGDHNRLLVGPEALALCETITTIYKQTCD